MLSFFFFFNDTATTEIYTLSLHDALPISTRQPRKMASVSSSSGFGPVELRNPRWALRSEEHTSELQSRLHLVCRLLLEKKKKYTAGGASVRRSVVSAVLELHGCGIDATAV